MPILSADEIYAVAGAAGFSPDQATTMTAIALAESGGNTAHRGHGEDSRGLWQINASAHPELAERYDLDDPLGNALAAYELSRAGTDMSPWTVTHGARDHRFLIGGVVAAAILVVIGLWAVITLGDPTPSSAQRTSGPVSTSADSQSPSVEPTTPATISTTARATTSSPTSSTTSSPSASRTSPAPTSRSTATPTPTPPTSPTTGPTLRPVRVVAVRAVPMTPTRCAQPWSARVVAAVSGDVVSVTATWVPAGGGKPTEVPLGATANPEAWVGTLAGLPPRTGIRLTVRATGRAGSAESTPQTLVPACPR